MLRTIKALAAALAIGVTSAGALASSTVNATFNSVSPGESFNYSLDGNGESTTAGVFNWTSVAGGTTNLGAYNAFCIELTQTINYGGTYLYNIDPLSNGPTPGYDTGGNGINGPMGATKAGDVEELWGRYYTNIFTGSSAQQQVNAAAFQIAIWDIVFGSNLNLASGNFHATNLSDPAVVLAQSELNSLTGTGPMANLIALDNSSAQDMVTTTTPVVPAGGSVPEAGTTGTAALGLAGLTLAALRRRKVAAA